MPIQNINDLMLREDVIEAVRQNKFHIYPIAKVEDGIEILTGVKAGVKTKNGYEEGTVFDKVEKKIREMFEKSRSIKGKNDEADIPKKLKTKQRKKTSVKSGSKKPSRKNK